MMRQSSSRNQRSKGGFKLRHFIQVCLLAAICIWLVYQIKHSRDKKRAFEERKIVEAQPLPLRFARKDLPIVQVSDSRSETRSVVEDKSGVEDQEEEEQDSRKEEAQDDDGNRGADDWIDEQDQDRPGEENEQEEFTSEEDNETAVEETGDSQGHEDSAVGTGEENHKSDNFSHSITQETHSTAVETGFADERTLDDKNLHNGDADMKGNSSIGAVVASGFYNSSARGDFNDFMTNSSSSSLGENITFPDAAKHPMNGTATEKNESNLGYINQKELQTNSTAALPQSTSMTTSSNSTLESHGEILGNKTSNLINFEEQNPAKFVEPMHELEDKERLSTGEEQDSDEHLKTGSFSTNEGDMSHNGATEEERMMAHTDLGVAGG